MSRVLFRNYSMLGFGRAAPGADVGVGGSS